MRKFALLLFAPLLAGVAPAQDRSEIWVYKVEFRIRDGSDAAAPNGRRYTMLLDTHGKGSFHLGDRVPVTSGVFQPGNMILNTQFTYLDTGVNIESTIRDINGKVALNSTIDISTVVQHKAEPGFVANPTVSQVRITIDAAVVPNKPTLVASIDDPVTQRRLDVEALLTRVD